MTKVDLITGFLGAGKTTFIHRYLHHLHDQKILIIENEFGSIGVDKQFLRNEACPIEDLSGVCMCCTGKDRFISMLIDAAAHGYDRLLVEPSGIYDVDEFFSVMDLPAVRAYCEIGCVLAIVDARKPEALSPESSYLMVTQLLAAGAIILSKTQFESQETIEKAIAWLTDLILEQSGEQSSLPPVCIVPWDDFTDEDYTFFQSCGHRRSSHSRIAINHGKTYGSFITAGYCEDEEDLREKLHEMMTDKRYGMVIRVKGFIRDEGKNWYEVNCTRSDYSVAPVMNLKRGVLVVIGQDLNEGALSEIFPRGR